ncbi:CHAT domain-containing tetratricopeptide repeat protein [Flaviaesturariibacter amylovorans]|uniref:CHAT domain-containing protein n=1 Tax=Flaviaesturariibacter amylovorans TaxID=1084520 RepID=A0ABP8G779_9BACT
MWRSVTLCFLLLAAGCPALAQVPPAARARFTEADRYYGQALLSGLTDEAAEERLNRKALQGFQAFLREPLPPGRTSDSLLLAAHIKAGELEQYFGDNTRALAHYTAGIAAHRRARLLPDSLLFRPYIFCGIISYAHSRLDSARYYFDLAERVQAAYPKPLHESERLYNNMGAIFFEAGNYRQARNYFEKALEVLPRSHPYYAAQYVNYRSNIAAGLVRLEEYDKAMAAYRELLAYGAHANEIRNVMGIIRLRQGAPAEAIRLFRQVHYGDARAAGLHNDLAQAFLENRQPDSAARHIVEAMTLGRRYNGDRPSTALGQSLKLRGDLARMLGRYDAALADYQGALHQFYPAFTGTQVADNPTRYSGLFPYLNVFQALLAKAEVLQEQYARGGALVRGDAALAAYRSAFALVDHIGHTYESDEARLFLQKARYTVHGKPIDLAFALYRSTGNTQYLEGAFTFDQQNKAAVLAYNEGTWRNARGGDTLWQREQALRADITRWSLRAQRSQDSATRATAEAAIRSGEIALGKLRRQRAERHPLALPELPSVKHLQQDLLDNDTRLLSFHLAGNQLTTFALTRDGFTGLQQPLYAGFHRELEALVRSLRVPDSVRTDAAAVQRLHRLLLGPVRGPQKRLLIIADDELHYLPFEVLHDGARYVVEDHRVQYQYSTALLKKERLALGDARVLAFAPFARSGFSGGGLSFAALPATSVEIPSGAGRAWTGADATRQRFLDEVARYDIVHLATHAVANTEQPALSYIAFAPWAASKPEAALLYAGEIYDLQLRRNRLIILSACETGSGALVRGEGLLSLSRAFAYAGCSNIITSLWKADDEATAAIIRRVHHYLEKGDAPDAALQQAKRDYLADPKVHPRRKLPAYWAHLVYSGALPEARDTRWMPWLTSGLAAALLVLLWIGWRRRRSRFP